MNCPPTKRPRGLDQEVAATAAAMAFDDPFGDDEDFTQDDLNEIDIIASQAITSTPAAFEPGLASKQMESSRAFARPAAALMQSKPQSRTATTQSRENMFGFNRGNAGIASREPLGTRKQPQVGSDLEDSRSVLEAQHAQLKRKLKEVEEEIVLKSGEIRVLRDSLKAAQQEKEAQKQTQLLLDAQRQKEQSDKERELSKKVQSLQSELQFKEAEINDMKTKLHNSDRNKLGSPPPRNSPKITSSLAQKHHGNSSSSSSPIGNGFITKETFAAAQPPSRTTPVKTKRDGGSSDDGSFTDSESTLPSRGSNSRPETSRLDPFQSVRPARLQHRGGVLLGLLLQQPLSPSSLGLSHLLSMSLTDISATASRLTLRSDAAPHGGGRDGPGAALSPVQSLAVTGLNMLSQNQTAAAVTSRKSRSCPGAALLLPLLDLHLSRLCRSLDSLRSASAGSGGGASVSSPDSAASKKRVAAERPAEAGSSGLGAEDAGLAALRLLHVLLAHSDEVTEAVLSNQKPSCDANKKTDTSAGDRSLISQNALLPSLLRLCELGSGSSQGKEIALSAMRTLRVLADQTPHAHTDRLKDVLRVACACALADSRLQVVSECVGVLVSLADRQALAKRLCSQHDPCVLLKLLQFVRTRSQTQATHADGLLLDLQVVRLLSRLTVQEAAVWAANQQSTCQCHTELVQTVLIVFHRQWLELRGYENQTDSTGSTPPTPRCPSSSSSSSSSPWWRGPAASLLRESLLLLHWLLLHHGTFSESCRPLLHMYDQVIPAVRDTLRRIPELSESEELALEDICRSEGDDAEDMDADAGS